jgi:hypothetical protein
MRQWPGARAAAASRLDFDVTEVAVPRAILRDAGHQVVFATEKAGTVPAADPRLLTGVLTRTCLAARSATCSNLQDLYTERTGLSALTQAPCLARIPYLIAVLPQVAVRRETAMWRVFWVPQDAVRAGVRRRVLAGWDDLPGREDAAGVQAGDPIFLSPDYRVDPLLGLYVQSATFRKYTAETKRNYATDIALLLTFLWGRERAWTDAAERDLEDYEHWRRFAPGNRDRIGGTKWDRELAAFASLYGWAAKNGHVTRNPMAMKQVRSRNGEVVTAPAARAKDARPSNVHWLTPRTWRRWIDVGLRGHGRDGVPEPGWAGRLEDRNVAFTRLLVSSGLRRAEGGSLLTFEVPGLRLDGGRYYRGKVAAGVTRSKKDRTFYAAAGAIGEIEAYADCSRAWAVHGMPFGVHSWEGVFRAANERCERVLTPPDRVGLDPHQVFAPYATPHSARHSFALYMLVVLNVLMD